VQRPTRGVIALLLEKRLLNPDFARTILAWQHAGLSIERMNDSDYYSSDVLPEGGKGWRS
jgi:hypothetical protein